MRWFIIGWYDGCRYAAYGDQDTAKVPEWLARSLQWAADDGVIQVGPGMAYTIGDFDTMAASDVVQVLEALTTVEEVSGDFPPRLIRPIFVDTPMVY